MKILFVYSLDEVQSSQTPLLSWATIQFGISYISSMLKSHGHETRLLVLGCNKWKDGKQLMRSVMEEFDPQLVCFTATFTQYSFIESVARFAESHWPNKFLLVGGVHASLRPDDVINGPFDALCVGEGEYPTLELCNQLTKGQAPHSIANLWIKTPDGQIEKNDPREFLQDLDELPFPDRQMWEPWMKEHADTEFAVLLGRGCPYNCTYCCNHAIRKVSPGRYVRLRSSQNIKQEIASLNDQFALRNIYLEVETIAVNKAWAIELCDQLETLNATMENPLNYGCNYRVTPKPPDEQLFRAFQKANFHKINIGLESGSERVRREVLKRKYSNQDFLDAVAMARKYGLAVYVFNMIGLPGESCHEHMETVQLNRYCQPDEHYTGIFFPYPGTELHNTCIEQGLISDSFDSVKERKHAVVEQPDFSKTQIHSAHTWFDYRVYKGHKPMMVILRRVVATKVRANPTVSYMLRQTAKLPVLRYIHKRLAKIT